MDSWERFNETSLPDKKAFYSELYLEDITDKEYVYAQKVFEELKLKILGDNHDLCVQSNTLLLSNKTLEKSVLKYMNSIRLVFCLYQISMASLFKKDSHKIRIINRYSYATDG